MLLPSVSQAQYQLFITRCYGFYRPVEALLAACFEAPCRGLNMARCRKSGLLRRDLQWLGLSDPDVTPVCAALPDLTSTAAAFGCLYVLEGATLGGQVIYGHAANRFGYSVDHGASFFHGYGSQTGAMWRSFGQSITAFSANSPTDDDVVVAAAVSAFRTLRLWCSREGPA